MVDSRLAQWSALLDDVRCEMADMADEGVYSGNLMIARRYVNAALTNIADLERELTHGV